MPKIDFRTPQQLPILHFSANQAEDSVTSLTDIVINNFEKEFHYEINLEVDFLTAYRNNGFNLIAKACKQLPPDNYKGISNISFSTPESRDWSTVIQLQKIRNQETIDNLNSRIFLWNSTVNLRTVLDSFEVGALRALAEADKIFEEERVTLKVISGATAKSLGITIEKFDQDTTNNVQSFIFGEANDGSIATVNDLDISTKRQDLIYGFLRDPGSFTQKRAANLLSHKFRLNGLHVGANQNGQGYDFYNLQNNPIYMSLKTGLESIVNDGKVEENELGVVQVIERYKTKNIKIPFILKETEIGTEDFYLVFEIREETTNQVLQKISIKVPHAENIKYSKFPIEAPIVTAITSPGDLTAVLSIKQVSQNGVFVKIYKAEQATSVRQPIAKYVLVDTLAVSNVGDENEVIWEDFTYKPGFYTTYRVTSLNAFELESASFGSVVLYDSTVKPHAATNYAVSEKPTFCSLYTKYDRSRPETITVYIENIPWHVVSFTITRINLSNPDEELVTVAENVNIISDKPDSLFYFVDSGLTNRNLYEYYVEFWSQDGILRESTTTHRIVYYYADKESGITNLSAPAISNKGTIDVSFEIIKEKNKYEADYIQQAITLQGNKEEFQTLLEQNSSRLAPIFQTAMYRTNTQTGEVDSFGIIDSDLFIDSKYGPKNGVDLPQSGIKYIYTAITHRRDPETMFYDYEKTISSSLGYGTYTIKPAFISHPERKRDGLIVNELWLDKQPFDLFTFGDVVDIDQVEAQIPQTPPEIVNASSRLIAKEKTLITWSINGDKNFIDHFIINLNHNGIDTPVGTCRSFNNDSRYEFVDELNNGESGILQYKIIPVYYDYTNGKISSTNKIIFLN